MSIEAVEIQALVGHDDNGKSRCLVMPVSPSANAYKCNTPGKRVHANKFEIVGYDSVSTAPTEGSTDIDDISYLHEKFSFGSLHFDDSGAFHSPASSFDASRIARARSNQGGLLSIDESKEGTYENQSSGHNQISMMDSDDEDDDSSGRSAKMALGTNHSRERPIGFDGREHTNLVSTGRIVGSPSSIDRSKRLRADFYRYDSTPNVAREKDAFNGENIRTNDGSTGSMFANGTLDTSSRIGFYRVACSDSVEPLSCRQKVEQPALSCDSNFFSSNHTHEFERKGHDVNSEKDRSGSIFSALTRCFAPTQP